ncbi:Anaerobic selenocysteine-containing dehydrogenase [Pseudonocardia ammonioxydans]|uniref:Anaerobic selenocysteine-containing dehydrogenase n=1 Tax=Pseudonocardia ammonioxydans TaxID=260086 RepID=A0A1I4UHL8_PSUAM|nr:molybdopterin oxidoreductase family protein [Pseudonocardia ammonioxydans]SFM88497.1 Anaerobic selenocysteine-containing dehydrogenase [Pseudonocardia ammonioxydans]
MTTTPQLPIVDLHGSGTRRAICPHDCPDGCAMTVTVEDGRATAVRGDAEHPFTRGGLCVKVNNYVDRVYSPDRVTTPLRRTGPKGSGRFEPIGWDEALGTVAGAFRQVIDEHGAEAVLPVSYLGTQGTLNGLNVGDPFFNRMGATVSERTYCDSGASTAYVMSVGPTAGVDPESLVHARYIVIWACNMISTNLHLWPFVAEAQRRGAKVVVIDPVRHRTAARADWHIPIRPGTDGALAMALIHVITTEGLTDEAYVADHTLGIDELTERAADCTPEWAEAETGIPAADIRTLAREYAAGQPSMIRIGVAIERHPGGGSTVRAISCLPGLVGAWRRPGGGLLALPLWAFPVNWDTLSRPELRPPGTRVVNQFHLGAALAGEIEGPPIHALMVYNSNPVVVCPDQDKVLAGLAREDLFTVVSEQFLTDTATYADIVLPAATQLEQTDVMFSWGHFYIGLNRPSIPPVGEAVSNTELFRRLAAAMGYDDECFRMTDEELIAAAYDWSAPALAGITPETLAETGWARLNLPGPDEYAPHAEGGFPTPSGRHEFRSGAAAGGDFVLPLFRQGSNEFQPGGEVDPLPRYVPPPRADGAHPLSLISPKSHAYLNSSYANLPAQQRVQGEPAAWLHPADAEDRALADGDLVRVFNDRGEILVRAVVTADVTRGVVLAHMGAWRSQAKGQSTVNAVSPTGFADLGRAPTFSDTKVQVERA